MQDEVNQEESEQNEAFGMMKGADFTGKLMHMHPVNKLQCFGSSCLGDAKSETM